MSRTIKIALIAAGFLMAAGLIITFISVASTGFDTQEISDGDYVERTFKLEDDFESIYVDATSEDISFYETDGQSYVVSFQRDDIDVKVGISNNTLKVETEMTNWFSMGINFQNPTIKIYLNKTAFAGDLTIKSSSGNVDVPSTLQFSNAFLKSTSGDIAMSAQVSNRVQTDASSGNIVIYGLKAKAFEGDTSSGNITLTSCSFDNDSKITCSSGDITVKDSEFGSLLTETTSGDQRMNGVNVSGSLSCESSSGEMDLVGSYAGSFIGNATSGDITFDRFDSRKINIETSSGEVEGTLLSDKLFNVRTNSGDIDVPSPRGEDECNITTTSGDVEIKVK